jgi:glucose-6-phosphate isomerase
MTLKIDFEQYPALPKDFIADTIKLAQKNMSNWAKPFFMDVYAHTKINELKAACKPYMEKRPKHLIILGTGGSIQTMLAVQGLLKVKLHPVVSSRPKELIKVLKECQPDESLVIPISRAGNTLDINSTLDAFRNFPILGLSSQGAMYDYLKKINTPILPVPDLSGRFAASVCSVALVPMIIAGLDIDLFQKSLTEAYSSFKDLNAGSNNISVKLASYLYAIFKQGYRNVFSMPYSSYLEGSAGLFVQELSESSGKTGLGLLGTSQPAPLCQHSVLELLLGGSKGHTSPLLWTIDKEPEDLNINNPEFGLSNQTANSIISYQSDATLQALLAQGIPSAKINLKEFDLTSVAHLIAFIQSSVYYLCCMLNVPWDTNPLVNTGKNICNEAMKSGLSPSKRKEDRENVAKNGFSSFKFMI